MRFSYDAESDVLYVTPTSGEDSLRYVETDRGDILRFSSANNEWLSITIPFFEYRT